MTSGAHTILWAKIVDSALGTEQLHCFGYLYFISFQINIIILCFCLFVSFQNINLFSFGHLLKDGELLIKVSDQPPKKRYVI